MSSPASGRSAKSILLDIEGTTTPIAFVYEVLFPFARTHFESFLRQHADSEPVQTDLRGLRALHALDQREGENPPPLEEGSGEADRQSLVAYLHWLMDQDRKATPLKALQGKVWKAGYHEGKLRAQVFPDVPVALRRWRRQGKDVSIFSSGSVLAQKLLFAHTEAGDLTPLLRSYFDTATGAKSEADSYRRIAASLDRDPAELVFISDVVAELEAARVAGMETRLCVRPGNRPVTTSSGHALIESFDVLFP